MITCPPGESDEWVDKLRKLRGIRLIKLHSYTNKEIQVKFSHIHPTISVKKYILHNILADYSVKEYWHDVDYKFGVPNGSCTFILYEEELQRKPLPESIFLNNSQCWISYATRPITCHSCGKQGHFESECPTAEDEAFPSLEEAVKNHGDLESFYNTQTK